MLPTLAQLLFWLSPSKPSVTQISIYPLTLGSGPNFSKNKNQKQNKLDMTFSNFLNSLPPPNYVYS